LPFLLSLFLRQIQKKKTKIRQKNSIRSESGCLKDEDQGGIHHQKKRELSFFSSSFFWTFGRPFFLPYPFCFEVSGSTKKQIIFIYLFISNKIIYL